MLRRSKLPLCSALVSGVFLGLILGQSLAWAGLFPAYSCLSLQPLLWPMAAVLSVAFLSQALIAVARFGIRVEIFTRSPIDITTTGPPLQAEVTRVRI